jgi:hypothetical protein
MMDHLKSQVVGLESIVLGITHASRRTTKNENRAAEEQ